MGFDSAFSSIPGFLYPTFTHIACVIVFFFWLLYYTVSYENTMHCRLVPWETSSVTDSHAVRLLRSALGLTAMDGRDEKQDGEQGDIQSVVQTRGPPQATPQGAWKLTQPVFAVLCGCGLPPEGQPWQSGSLQPRQTWKGQRAWRLSAGSSPNSWGKPHLEERSEHTLIYFSILLVMDIWVDSTLCYYK